MKIIIQALLVLFLIITFIAGTPYPLRFVTGGITFVLMLVLGCGWRSNCS